MTRFAPNNAGATPLQAPSLQLLDEIQDAGTEREAFAAGHHVRVDLAEIKVLSCLSCHATRSPVATHMMEGYRGLCV